MGPGHRERVGTNQEHKLRNQGLWEAEDREGGDVGTSECRKMAGDVTIWGMYKVNMSGAGVTSTPFILSSQWEGLTSQCPRG